MTDLVTVDFIESAMVEGNILKGWHLGATVGMGANEDQFHHDLGATPMLHSHKSTVSSAISYVELSFLRFLRGGSVCWEV